MDPRSFLKDDDDGANDGIVEESRLVQVTAALNLNDYLSLNSIVRLSENFESSLLPKCQSDPERSIKCVSLEITPARRVSGR